MSTQHTTPIDALKGLAGAVPTSTSPPPPTNGVRPGRETNRGNGHGASAADVKWAEAAIEGEIAELAGARETDRNNQLFRSAASIAEILHYLPDRESEVIGRMESTARAIGLEEDEIGPTIRSGIKKGKANQRYRDQGGSTRSRPLEEPPLPEEPHDPWTDYELGSGPRTNNSDETPGSSDGTKARGFQDVIPAVDGGEPCTDLGNAERLVRYFGDRARYSAEQGWMCYDGKRWRRGDDEARELAKRTVRLIYGEAVDAGRKERREALAKHAVRSESRRAVDALLSLASSDPRIRVQPAELDADPWLFCCENGTLDLRTCCLLPHNPAHLITKLAPVAYDPQASAPTWERFVRELFEGSEGVADFMRRVAGYSITGLTSEQVWFLLWGAGSNGKTTFLDVLREMLGEYAQQAAPEMFLAKRFDGPTNDLARLQGARFVTAAESGEGRQLAEARIKQLTGGDRISCRFLNKEFFEFTPVLKLLFATNHKPRITGTDHAIWRRVRLVPFLRTWYGPNERGEPKRDNTLKEKLRAELPGILAWAVRGCMEWQQVGLAEPAAVLAATREYRSEMDIVEAFMEDTAEWLEEISSMDDAAIILHGWHVPAGVLYKIYTTWCESEGEKPQTQKGLAAKLAEKGFISKRLTDGVRAWWGLRLREKSRPE